MDGTFYTVDDVMRFLAIKKPTEYKIIQRLNNELKAAGYMTIGGRVSKSYFMERFGVTEKKKG